MMKNVQIRDGRLAMTKLAEHGMLDGFTVFDLAQMTDEEVIRTGAKYAAKIMEPLVKWIEENIFPALRHFLDEFWEWWESLPPEVRDNILEESTDADDRS